jgi:hypothetical protein
MRLWFMLITARSKCGSIKLTKTEAGSWQAAGVYRVSIKLPDFERFFRAGVV